MNKAIILYTALCIFALSGCATQQRQEASNVALAAQASFDPADPIAAFVGSNPTGAASALNDATGPVTVTVGKEYQSALNVPCKAAMVQGAQGMQNIAVCKQSDIWHRAPSIFSSAADGHVTR